MVSMAVLRKMCCKCGPAFGSSICMFLLQR